MKNSQILKLLIEQAKSKIAQAELRQEPAESVQILRDQMHALQRALDIAQVFANFSKKEA